MDPGKKIELHIPSILGFEKIAMDVAASVAAKMGFTDERIEDLKTAVSEACLNAIEHGNKMDAGIKVGISLTGDESKLMVVVSDEGNGSIKINTPNIEEKIEGRDSPKGWGIFLIKSLIDEVEFEAKPDGGNAVKMVIHLQK